MYVNRAWQGRRRTVRQYAQEFPGLGPEAPVEQAHVEEEPVEQARVEEVPAEQAHVEQEPVEQPEQRPRVRRERRERPERGGQQNRRNEGQAWPGYKPPVPEWAKKYTRYGSDDWQAEKDQRQKKEREADLAKETNVEKESEREQPQADAYGEWLKEGIARGKREERPVEAVPNMFAWQ
ncbi:unnamed protein product [Caenorhabditis sp. 36 PRJEB53466]|nr:unnamed protein product [Caenorhabditis sp. 36 PRJEB53466]